MSYAGPAPWCRACVWHVSAAELLQLALRWRKARRSATGTVTFTNAKELRTVTLDLVKTGSGWRIAEIRAPSGSLKELYKVK